MNLYKRITALITIIAFGGMVTSPAAAAMRMELEDSNRPTTSVVEAQDERERLSQAVLEARDSLRKLAGKPDLQNRVASLDERREARERLKALRTELREMDQQTRADFAKTRTLIEERNLPDVIIERHAQALAEYEARANALLTDLEVIESADESAAIERAKTTSDRLESYELERAHQPFDPDHLPNRSLQPPEDNEPKLSPEAFLSAAEFSDYSTALAANEEYDLTTLSDANDAAYLAETSEVVISEAIEAKAAELGHDPIAIYNFVRNNVEWQPYWGAVQNADLTLSAMRGTAMDIASLTIALLRASGIPARYAHGTIELDEAVFRNWVGGFEHIDAAIHFAASGGIPVQGVRFGGVITKVRMQHIWVEAAVDFAPSRGAVNRAADTWVSIDPSFKQYEYLAGLDPIKIGGIDPEALVNQFLASGTINEEQGWITGFDPAVVESAQQAAAGAVEDYIAANLPEATVGDVIGGRRIIGLASPVLAGALSTNVLVLGARHASLPDFLRQHMTFALAGEHTVTLRWSEINNQRITLSFKPATPADEAALQSLLPIGEITDISQLPSSIPSYLVNVVPELKLGDEVILSGDALSLGNEVRFSYTPHLAGGRTGAANPYNVIAGSYLAVSANAGAIAPVSLNASRARIEAVQAALGAEDPDSISDLTREDLLGEIFHAGLLGYYGQYTALSYLAGLKQGGHHYLGAGLGTFGYEPDVHTVMGFPMAIRGGSAVMNIPILNIFGYDNDGSVEGRQRRVNYIVQVGTLSSTLEHAVPEQIFVTEDTPGEAISAVRALEKARAAGQRVYQINPSNQTQVLPAVHHSPNVMAEIRNALGSGRVVITHTDPVAVPGWSGAGYIILDPVTGDGAYKIGGGQNGSDKEIPDHSLKIFLGISAGVIGIAALIAAGAPFLAFFLAVLFLIDFMALMVTITQADSPRDNQAISNMAGVMFIVALAAFIPVFAALGTLGGILVFTMAFWATLIGSAGAF